MDEIESVVIVIEGGEDEGETLPEELSGYA